MFTLKFLTNFELEKFSIRNIIPQSVQAHGAHASMIEAHGAHASMIRGAHGAMPHVTRQARTPRTVPIECMRLRWNPWSTLTCCQITATRDPHPYYYGSVHGLCHFDSVRGFHNLHTSLRVDEARWRADKGIAPRFLHTTTTTKLFRRGFHFDSVRGFHNLHTSLRLYECHYSWGLDIDDFYTTSVRRWNV